MTNTNIHIMDIIVDKLSHGKTLSQALKTVYSKRNVSIPFDEKFNDVSISSLDLSSRVFNPLMRNRLTTIGEVVQFCRTGGIMKARGLGKHGAIELFEAILDWCWNHMNNKEKTNFLIDTVERNECNIKEELQ